MKNSKLSSWFIYTGRDLLSWGWFKPRITWLALILAYLAVINQLKISSMLTFLIAIGLILLGWLSYLYEMFFILTRKSKSK